MATAKYDEPRTRWVLRYRVPSPTGKCYRNAHKRVLDKKYPGMSESAKARRQAEMQELVEKLERDACGKTWAPAAPAKPAKPRADARAKAAKRAAAQRIVKLMLKHGITVNDLIPLYSAER